MPQGASTCHKVHQLSECSSRLHKFAECKKVPVDVIEDALNYLKVLQCATSCHKVLIEVPYVVTNSHIVPQVGRICQKVVHDTIRCDERCIHARHQDARKCHIV